MCGHRTSYIRPGVYICKKETVNVNFCIALLLLQKISFLLIKYLLHLIGYFFSHKICKIQLYQRCTLISMTYTSTIDNIKGQQRVSTSRAEGDDGVLVAVPGRVDERGHRALCIFWPISISICELFLSVHKPQQLQASL